MSSKQEFLDQLRAASNEKLNWFNGTELPCLLENYRLLHTCVRNLYDALIKKSLITADPYKLEKKISKIEIPEDTPFIENEKSVVIGARFSDYESMLDFLCTYFKFSVENVDLGKIKKLNELNNAFQWQNMTLNNSKTNTRGLASLIADLRKNSPQLQLSMISDSVTKSSTAISEITRILKELSDFKREEYKLNVRFNLMTNSAFDESKTGNTVQGEITEIKRNFASVLGKTPFYSELIQEIAEEDYGENSEQLRQAVLAKMKIEEKKVVQKKNSVDTKAMLLDCIRTISTLSPIYSEITQKLRTNYQILEGRKITLMFRIKKALRQIFGMKEKPVMYKLIITDQKKGTKTSREVDIVIFTNNIERRSSFYELLSNQNSAENRKISSSPEDALLQYLNKQISENKETLTLLEAADEYFKSNAATGDRTKIKGLKIDLVTVNNIIVKANQKRAEYVSYIEEINQMKKLGIKDV